MSDGITRIFVQNALMFFFLMTKVNVVAQVVVDRCVVVNDQLGESLAHSVEGNIARWRGGARDGTSRVNDG
ncbi:MAG: hypothetical protein CUN54_10670, partial [Phototrophicales bacterium]